MTYEEIKAKLTKCEIKLQQIKTLGEKTPQSSNIKTAVQKLTLLKESLQKQLKEADKGVIYTDDETKAKELSDKGSNVKLTKEQEGVAFSVDETKAIAKKVGKAVAQALRTVGDEVAHMKAKDIEENSFEIYVEYKNGSDDQFSFFISDDTLHLVDFSFDKELVDVGVKPSGEAIVNVDVLANELVKHFKSTNEGMSDQEWADAQEKERLDKHPEKDTIMKIKDLLAKEKEKQLKEAPKGLFYIEVAVRDARKALAIIDDQPALSRAIQYDGSTRYYLKDEELAYDLMMDFNAHDVEVVDNNIELDEASDYARRRAAERDYQPSKKDKPAKAYKEPKNDYFARRKKELDYKYGSAGQEMYEGEEQYTVAGRPVKLHKGESSDGTDWSVEFENGKTTELSSVLSLIKPFPKGITAEGDVDGGDLDVGHQDDEPDMLMKDIYDIATYAAKLHKMLKKYNDFDGEVDFPHWWQKKVTLARDYISAAQHYLEAEEKQPALDQLALENKGATKGEEEKFHKDLDTLVHKTFGKRKEELKEDWGGSDQAAMNQQIHKALGEPKKMPSPFDDRLEYAVQDAVDFHWDDWPEYQQDREGLYTQAKRAYLRAMFRDTFDKMVRMFEPANEGVAKTKKAYDLVVTKMKDLAKVYKSGDTSVIGQLKDLTAKKKQLEKMLDKDVSNLNRDQELVEEYSAFKSYDDIIGGLIIRADAMKKFLSKHEPDLVPLADQLEAIITDLDYKIGDIDYANLNEAKATCCGKCGRVHVKGTKCKTPYLKGKDHCRYN